MSQFAKPYRAKCVKCKRTTDVHLSPEPGQIPGAHGSHRYICASCEYLESHPDAARVKRERGPKEPQAETLLSLLDVSGPQDIAP